MQQTTIVQEDVHDYQIDPKIGAVKLIEALLEMGKINQATYTIAIQIISKTQSTT